MRTLIAFSFLLTLSGLVFAQGSNSEIFLFDIEKKESDFAFLNGENITNNKSYDNQPSFSLDGKSILFTSGRNSGNFDIFEYSIADKNISELISSENGEYTAKEFDKNTVMFVREGKNDQGMGVWKFDRRTRKSMPALKNKEPIAYYAFNRKGDALVWIRYAFMMHWVNPESSINRFVANYAQPSVPHLIPGTDKFSFMQRHPDDSLWIKEFDPATRAVRPIVPAKDGEKDYAWMPDGSLLIGSGSKLFSFNGKTDKSWKEAADLKVSGIKDITRMAVSPDGKNLALVDNR
ncbi:MAG: hypothetical protein HKN25_03885 [Pyrinomonadaceae bacterium]|nr:hypothetical protein [Pyrinomonadaceae bacterium]